MAAMRPQGRVRRAAREPGPVPAGPGGAHLLQPPALRPHEATGVLLPRRILHGDDAAATMAAGSRSALTGGPVRVALRGGVPEGAATLRAEESTGVGTGGQTAGV